MHGPCVLDATDTVPRTKDGTHSACAHGLDQLETIRDDVARPHAGRVADFAAPRLVDGSGPSITTSFEGVVV